MVPRTSCGLPESAGVRVAHASMALCSLSLGRRHSTQACCARAVPRWLWSVGALGKGSAPTRGPSPSARGRGATYQLRPPRISSLFRGTRKRATALTVSREKAQYASLLCARAVPRCSWSVHPLGKGIITPAGGFSLSTRGRGATHQLRPPRTSRCSRGRRERATALAVSREEAQHASMLRARAVPRCS